MQNPRSPHPELVVQWREMVDAGMQAKEVWERTGLGYSYSTVKRAVTRRYAIDDPGGPIQEGERRGINSRKLTRKDVERVLRDDEDRTHAWWATELGVSPGTIRFIRKGETWKGVYEEVRSR